MYLVFSRIKTPDFNMKIYMLLYNMLSIHIVINNNSHDSVGGQPTNAFDIDFKKLGYSIGYNECYSTNRQNIFEDILEKALTDNQKSYFIEVKVKKGSRDNLGRPKEIPVENKKHFIKKWSNH